MSNSCRSPAGVVGFGERALDRNSSGDGVGRRSYGKFRSRQHLIEKWPQNKSDYTGV